MVPNSQGLAHELTITTEIRRYSLLQQILVDVMKDRKKQFDTHQTVSGLLSVISITTNKKSLSITITDASLVLRHQTANVE